MRRLPQKAADNPAAFSAIWVGLTEYYMAAPDGRVIARPWKTPPACDDPARLVHWAVTLANHGEWKGEPLAFSLLLSPEIAAAFAIPEKLPKNAETLWEEQLAVSGWRFASHGSYGPWTIIQAGPRRQVEVGICVVPWVPTGLRARAAHGIAYNTAGELDPFGTMFVHAQYRCFMGWPLSGGAGMAGVKALWRWTRKKQILWAPPAEDWEQLTFLRSDDAESPKARSTQRPWHLYWTTHPAPVLRAPGMTHAMVWDRTAAYLTAWSAARLARGMLVHTGSGVQPNAKGSYPAGYYRIGAPSWRAELLPVVERLPPLHGSRQLLADGSVWVTHEVLDGLAALDIAYPKLAPVATLSIYDSWTCEDYGQVAKQWGEKIRHALGIARAEAEVAQDPACDVLALACKATYAEGYPLVERGGIMRRPDHVDALIDHMGSFGRFNPLFRAALEHGVYPLDVSADEITMPCYADPYKFHPLAREESDRSFHVKLNKDGTARVATLGEWEEAHRDGRAGRWWNSNAPAPRSAARTGDAPNTVADDDSALLAYMMGED